MRLNLPNEVRANIIHEMYNNKFHICYALLFALIRAVVLLMSITHLQEGGGEMLLRVKDVKPQKLRLLL